MEEDPQDAKRRLRKTLLAARRRVPRARRADIAAAVCSRIIASAPFADARCLAGYAAIGGEIDPRLIVDTAIARGYSTYFPCLEGDDLVFRRARPFELAVGKCKVPEPPAVGELLDVEASVLVLVPAVGFDLEGRRLGRGGGHYDRALPRYRHAFCLGIGSEAQIVERLPEEPWDHSMHMIVTENRIISPAGHPWPSSKESASC